MRFDMSGTKYSNCEFCGELKSLVYLENWMSEIDSCHDRITISQSCWACDPCAERIVARIASYDCKFKNRNAYGDMCLTLNRKHVWVIPVPQVSVILDKCTNCKETRNHVSVELSELKLGF